MPTSKTVLVVEDEKSIRQAMIDTLVLKNFQTLEAQDGEEGLAIALRARPDLILLDLLMPKMDGMTALKKLREDPWGANVPVIILTNLNATDENIIDGMVTNKPLHYLIKSDWDIDDIMKEIDKVFEA